MEAPDMTAEHTAVEASATAVGPNVLRVGDSFICSGIEPMSIPLGVNQHLRDVLIRLPVQFIGRPTVTAVCEAEEGPAAAGVPYPVYGIGIALQGLTHTAVRISAANITPGQQLDGLFLCHYVVIGKAKT